MKNSVLKFWMVVVVSSIAMVFVIALHCVLFRRAEVPLIQPFLRVLGLGSGFMLVICGVSIPWASCYRFDYKKSGITDKEKIKALQRVGKLPLVFFLQYSILALLWLSLVGFLAHWIGLSSNSTGSIVALNFAWGLVAAASIYNLADNVSIHFIAAQHISEYPQDLREHRQQMKAIIIPLFTLILGSIYALSLGVYVMLTWGGFSVIPVVLKAFLGISIVFFFFSSVFLLKVWSGNMGFVFASVISQLDQLSSAEKNLQSRINIASVDEMSTIAGLVNLFTSGLSQNISEIKAAQNELIVLGNELRDNAQESSVAAQKISDSMDKMKEKSVGQTRSVQEVSGAVEQIAGNIASLDSLIIDQASSVTEASASIEEMVSSIGSINKSMNIMAQQFGELAHTAREGMGRQEETAQKIAVIAENSRALQEANKVIAGIAAQTNLLAMNAAIEAAHAGDAGRGFAVVADEIRSLAENASKNSKKINQVLGNVHKDISTVVDSSAISKQSFNELAEKIGATDALVQEFKMAIGEQQDGAHQILEALRQMNDITSHVQSGSAEMNRGNETILREVGLLKESSSEISSSIILMSSGIADVEKESHKISSMAKRTNDTIGKLEDAVGSFKTDIAG